MEYLGVIGFAMAGFLLPELIKLATSSMFIVPTATDIMSALSAGLISTSFLIN
jgi:hypothetical protein